MPTFFKRSGGQIQGAKVSKEITGNTIVKNLADENIGACVFYGILVETDTSTDVAVQVYDGQDNSGDPLLPSSIKVKGSNYSGSFGFTKPVICSNGLYVEISGGTPKAVIQYDD